MRTYKVAFAQFPGNGVSRMETNAWVVQTVRKLDREPQAHRSAAGDEDGGLLVITAQRRSLPHCT